MSKIVSYYKTVFNDSHWLSIDDFLATGMLCVDLYLDIDKSWSWRVIYRIRGNKTLYLLKSAWPKPFRDPNKVKYVTWDQWFPQNVVFYVLSDISPRTSSFIMINCKPTPLVALPSKFDLLLYLFLFARILDEVIGICVIICQLIEIPKKKNSFYLV